MANSITTSTLNTVGIIGDSIMTWGGSEALFTAAPYLRPNTNVIWKNIWVFTNKQGWPTDSPAGSPPPEQPSWTVSDGTWLEMTTHLTESPAEYHPHSSPYSYPNVVGHPAPTYLYNASYIGSTGTLIGVEIPLMWHLSEYYSDQVGLIKMSPPGTYGMRYDEGGLATTWFSLVTQGLSPDSAGYPYTGVDSPVVSYNWWTPNDRMDWDPSTGRLYESFIAKCVAARDDLPVGTSLNMETVVIGFGNNDCGTFSADTPRINQWGQYVKKFVAKLRADMVANRLTLLPADQVKIVWLGINDVFGTPTSDEMNTAAAAVAKDDPWMRFIDMDEITYVGNHPNHLGYLELAPLILDAIESMDVGVYDAMDPACLMTVAQLKTRILLEYTRGKVNTDIGDELLLAQINSAMHTMIEDMGDQAWFLRRRQSISFSGGGYNNPIALPKMVHQVMKVEAFGDVTNTQEFEQVGFNDGGRMLIAMPQATSGTYIVHYMRMPKDLVTDAERVPIPQQLLQWLISETCVRLATAAANPVQVAAFQAQAMKSQAAVMKKLSATTRSRKDRLYTQRRLPDVLRRPRLRRWDNL